MDFPTDYQAILERINHIDPKKYARSRNFLNGAVTYLSPYLTHGVISPIQVIESVLEKYSFQDAEKLIFELAWREFFHSVWSELDSEIFVDLKSRQEPIQHYEMPESILLAETGINAIDQAIRGLYETGYIHNHARMWIASLTCNIGQAHWYNPSCWMYYYLLDGDLASNSLSWQWCAGSFASKKYYANQENLNRYATDSQKGTMIDTSYEELAQMAVPEKLTLTRKLHLKTDFALFEKSTLPAFDPDDVRPVALYHPWMLDPQWRATEGLQRVLWIDTDHFREFPISLKRIQFILQLAQNIPQMRILVGPKEEIEQIEQKKYTKEYPALPELTNTNLDPREKMFNPPKKYYKSFFAYWKACEGTEEFASLRT